ncbi:MAG: hypothetical protein CME06_01810 [Gemmatimonadetes bacterium]|nr:hypothetical protein [Gemmatimonadota bacterium]
MRKKNGIAFRVGAALVFLIATLALLEASAFFVMVVKDRCFYLRRDLKSIDQPHMKQRYEEVYDKELGWEIPSRARYDLTEAAICLFGDSFTYGHPDIDSSWPRRLEAKLGEPVLNYGVPGYGTDQAYLRFEKRYVGKVKSRYVCLGILAENIARNLSRYRGFYWRNGPQTPTKPRFYIEDDGEIVLLPNPIDSPDGIERLGDIAFLREIGQKDYWFHFYDEYNLNEQAGFPYSYYLLKALPFYVRSYHLKRIQNAADYMMLYDDVDATRVLEHIIDTFIRRAREHDTAPIILFFPDWKELQAYEDAGEPVYRDFYRQIKAKHRATFDAFDYFRPSLDQGEAISSFFISYTDGHYSSAGEEIMSDGILRDLEALELNAN